MNLKTILTAVLLVFVAASVLFLIAKESEGPTETLAGARRESLEQERTIPAHQVVVNYFHGNVRCATCRKFETYTTEVMENGFAEELKSGTLEFRIINVDEPENGHYVQDYQLTTRSVVVADFKDGKETGWKNLERIWQLVGNKEEFLAYIRTETRAYLEGEI